MRKRFSERGKQLGSAMLKKIIQLLLLFATALTADTKKYSSTWQGKVFEAKGKVLVVYSSNTSGVTSGKKLFILRQGKVVGEGLVESTMHTNIRMKLTKGGAIAGDRVSDRGDVANATDSKLKKFIEEKLTEADEKLINAAGGYGDYRQKPAEALEQAVEEALKEGARINAKRSGQPAICGAASRGHAKIVARLIQAGAEVNTQLQEYAEYGWKGCNPLSLAASEGHIEVAKILIAAKADINLGKGNRHGPPLMWAAQYGKAESVKLLLEAGSEINVVEPPSQNVSGRMLPGGTPLTKAIEEGAVQVVEILIAAKADVNLPLINGEKPLTIAKKAMIPNVARMVELLTAAGATE